MLDSPIATIFNTAGLELAVSQSQIVSGAQQPAMLIAGSGSNGGAVFFKMSPTGELFITGSIQTTATVSQSVKVDQWSAGVTGAMNLTGWLPTVTGAVGISSWQTTVTGAMGVSSWQSTVTGAMGVTSWVGAVTASIKEIGFATTVVSAALASVTNFIFLAPNQNRTTATFYKEGSNTAYLKLGAVASATSYTVRLINNSYYELPKGYSGRVDIIFSDAAGSNTVYVTEISP